MGPRSVTGHDRPTGPTLIQEASGKATRPCIRHRSAQSGDSPAGRVTGPPTCRDFETYRHDVSKTEATRPDLCMQLTSAASEWINSHPAWRAVRGSDACCGVPAGCGHHRRSETTSAGCRFGWNCGSRGGPTPAGFVTGSICSHKASSMVGSRRRFRYHGIPQAHRIGVSRPCLPAPTLGVRHGMGTTIRVGHGF